MVIPEDQWHSVRDALMGMKVRRKLRGELKWRYFAPGNDDEANPNAEARPGPNVIPSGKRSTA